MSEVMSVIGVIFGFFSCSTCIYFFSVSAFICTTLFLCFQAAYQGSDEYFRARVLQTDHGIKALADYENPKLKENRAMYFHIMQQWKSNARKQIIILTARIQKKQELVRNHCLSILEILKEELTATEIQARLIPVEDKVEYATDNQYLQSQLLLVRGFVEDMESNLKRYPLIRPHDSVL